MTLLPFALVLAYLFSGTSAEADPCLSYLTINDTKRSTSYVLPDGQDPISDSELPAGWYRFTSGAGGQMPEKCVDRFHCGTIIPAWLNGTHPEAVGEEVARQVCFNFHGNDPSKKCCEHRDFVAVKNCGEFYLYYLKTMPRIHMAYCAGAEAPCGEGKGSVSGFTPCEDVYPVMDDPADDPVLTGPEIQNHAFRFKCDVTYPENDPDLVFEVQWTFDGQPDPNIPNKILTGDRREAYLFGTALTGHMGQDLGCQVRAWYQNKSVIEKSPWRDSNMYWVGVRTEPDVVEISEKRGSANVTLTSTVPIVCDHNKACCLSFILDADGPKDNMVVSNPCQHKLCTDDWDPHTLTAHTDITVMAAKDNIRDQNNQMLLSFQTLFPGSGGPFLNIFNNYTMPTAQVNVKDSPSRLCYWAGDPHFVGFSGNHFHLFDVGDFTVYENRHDHFEIQSRNIRCNRKVSCQCALAIKEHQDVIRIDNCHSSRRAPRIETTGNLRTGTVIKRSTNRLNMMVYLPSGREVKLDVGPYYHNVYLTVPGSDENHGRGICGTLDSNSNNEFTHRNGYNDLTRCHQPRHCIPTNFTNSWKNNHTTSLFETKPQDPDIPIKDPHYCQCDKDGQGINRINCTVGADVTHTAQRCSAPNCHDVTSTLPAILQGPGMGWVRRYVMYADVDEPDPPLDFTPISPQSWNITWPTPSGITEDQAKRKCREEIEDSQLHSHCSANQALIDEIIDQCITDIMYGDNFDMLDSAVQTFTSICQYNLIQDVSNYNTDASGKLVLKDSITNVCSLSCLRHGACVNGACLCASGYTGENCDLQRNTPPTLNRVRGSSFCDLNNRPCRTVYFDADHFEMTDSLKCRVNTILPNGQKTHHEDKAQFISGDRLACTLPDASNHAKTEFSVSVPMDGHHYSNALSITSFDSSCMSCDTRGCKQISDTCLILNRCYQNNDLKTGDATKMCNTSASTSQWTTVPGSLIPHVANPTVSGPSLDLTVSCNIHSTSHDPRTRFEVTWYVNDGVEVGKETLAADERTAVKSVTVLPPSAEKVYCKVRSFFEGSSDFSPYMPSSSLPLLTVTGTRDH